MLIIFSLLGVYELVTYQLKPGGPAIWGESFKAAIEAHNSKGYAKLIGVFHTEYGALNTGIVLIPFTIPLRLVVTLFFSVAQITH